jgi:hypothetical protein
VHLTSEKKDDTEDAMGQRALQVILVGIVWTFIMTAFVAAQQSVHPSPSMGDMMQECQTHCERTTTAIDQLTAQMKAAAESNDPAQMRAALPHAQQPLTAIKAHMGMCRNMMSMMQRMPGGMGGQMQKQ